MRSGRPGRRLHSAPSVIGSMGVATSAGNDLVHTARMEMMNIVRPIKWVVDLLWRMFYHSLEVDGEGNTYTFQEASRVFSVAM